MIRKFLIFILVLFSFSALKAEVVKKVVVEGNKRISTETIKIYGEIEINKDLSENDINKILNNLYGTFFNKE